MAGLISRRTYTQGLSYTQAQDEWISASAHQISKVYIEALPGFSHIYQSQYRIIISRLCPCGSFWEVGTQVEYMFQEQGSLLLPRSSSWVNQQSCLDPLAAFWLHWKQMPQKQYKHMLIQWFLKLMTNFSTKSPMIWTTNLLSPYPQITQSISLYPHVIS